MDKTTGGKAVEFWALNALVPYARNARQHSEDQIKQIAKSIEAFGFVNPVLIDDEGGIVAGHGRVLAAEKLGMAEIPCLRVGWLTEEEKRAYILADNKIALNASWDDGLLAVELESLGGLVKLIGFTNAELRSIILKNSGLTDIDAVPALDTKAVSRHGDLWSLGDHWLLCGDATNAEDVARLLRSVKPALMITDPPYGVSYDPSWRKRAGVNFNPKKLGLVSNDDRDDWTEAWALFPGSVAYVWHAGLHAATAENSLREAGFDPRSQIIWAKDRFALSRSDYHWQHEPCWYAVRAGDRGGWAGDRSQTTLWMIPARDDSGHGHGTQKPVECMRKPIVNSSNEGMAVYDPFMGSGTTMMAAHVSNRLCYGIDIDPLYVDVAIRRWQEFTGLNAVLNGKTFTEVESARTKAKADKPKTGNKRQSKAKAKRTEAGTRASRSA